MKKTIFILIIFVSLGKLSAQSCQSSFDFSNTSNPNRSVSVNATTPENLYDPNSGFTWECWFNLGNLKSTQITTSSLMISATDAQLYQDLAIGFNWPHNPTTPGLIFMLSDNGSSNTRYVLKTNMTFDSNTWYHVAGVCDYNGNKMLLLVNGSIVDSTTINLQLSNRLRGIAVSIGNDDRTVNPYWNPVPFVGLIDEVRFWNIPRTKNQISSDMNVCLPSTTSNLISYYKADENLGTTSTNFMNSSLYKATLNNSATWGSQKMGLNCCSNSAIYQQSKFSDNFWLEQQVYLNKIIFHHETLKNEPNLTIKVYDLFGKEVNELKCNSENSTLDISNLSDGMYIYSYYLNNDIVSSGKLMINR